MRDVSTKRVTVFVLTFVSRKGVSKKAPPSAMTKKMKSAGTPGHSKVWQCSLSLSLCHSPLCLCVISPST